MSRSIEKIINRVEADMSNAKALKKKLNKKADSIVKKADKLMNKAEKKAEKMMERATKSMTM